MEVFKANFAEGTTMMSSSLSCENRSHCLCLIFSVLEMKDPWDLPVALTIAISNHLFGSDCYNPLDGIIVRQG